MKPTIQLVCPDCKTELRQEHDHLNCQDCGASYPIRDGIPSFARSDFYWNEIPQADMHRVLNVAQSEGWQTAAYDVLNPRGSHVHATVGDERRADWKYLLPISKESRVLDLGCGWGAASMALAEIAGQVVSMDATWERVRFLDIRRQQQGVTNITPIHGGDTLTFPFPDGQFDLIVLVGVLEWLGESYPELPPREAQLKALHNLRRLLAPGGRLYIAIENRFGYDYLMGRPDHNGIPFVGLLPRSLADWVSRKKTGEPFRTYQYSMAGYRQLLEEAGFGGTEFYGNLPQYRHPHFYLPLDQGRGMEFFLANMWESFLQSTPGRAQDYRGAYQVANLGLEMAKRLNLSGFARHVVPGFSIIAERV